MKATDTFRKTPFKHNCAQAIAYRWNNLFDNNDIVSTYAPYIGGHAPEGYCGALYAAMQACPKYADKIKDEFTNICGATRCYAIKTENRTPCEICVDTADKLVEKYSDL